MKTAAQKQLQAKIDSENEILEVLRVKFETANDSNDVQGQVNFAIAVTEQVNKIAVLERALAWVIGALK